ncbi:MAG: GAF domain-containing sensor histidine kinase, partial [Tumebacillaceae bacterium]
IDTLTAEQRRTAVLRALAEASIKINSALSLDVLLQTITDQARNIVGAQQAYTTFIPKGEWTHNISCASFDEHSPAPEPASKESARFLFACRLNKPIRITAENHADRQWWSLTGNAPERQSVDSWLAAPLLTRDGRNLGLIQLSLKLNGEFTEEDEAIVVQLAQMASVAIENARLYREAQEQITERTRAQEALERSKESMQLAQRSVGIGIWEWDLQRGNLSWSDEISQLHGVSTDTFDGTFEGWINTIHPEDRELVLREVSQALGGGAEYQIQYRVILERGAIRWLESRGQVFSIGSTPIRVIAVALDVTSRKQSEEALRKSEKLATAGRLAATIAHEINNPLAAMTNLLYLLRTSVSRDEQASEHLRSAEAELARVVHITKQTLAFHRELSSPVEIDLPELINDVLTNYSWKLESLNLSVTKKYSPVKALVGYPNELRQVFSNFLLNALEASQANSEIVIRVRDCGDMENSRGIRIMIADHGSGIEPENLSRVFEPFFTTKEDKGTGLGLWVSEGIVHKHGGNIRVRSRSKGKTGTCFSIFLPYTDAQSSRASVGNGAIVAA